MMCFVMLLACLHDMLSAFRQFTKCSIIFHSIYIMTKLRIMQCYMAKYCCTYLVMNKNKKRKKFSANVHQLTLMIM